MVGFGETGDGCEDESWAFASVYGDGFGKNEKVSAWVHKKPLNGKQGQKDHLFSEKWFHDFHSA